MACKHLQVVQIQPCRNDAFVQQLDTDLRHFAHGQGTLEIRDGSPAAFPIEAVEVARASIVSSTVNHT